MLNIKLSRMGKKKQMTYRLVISEKGRDPYGRALEILGSYNPHTKELKAKEDRIKHWIANGAQSTEVVHNLLIKKGITKGKKIKVGGVAKNIASESTEKPEEKK